MVEVKVIEAATARALETAMNLYLTGLDPDKEAALLNVTGLPNGSLIAILNITDAA